MLWCRLWQIAPRFSLLSLSPLRLAASSHTPSTSTCSPSFALSVVSWLPPATMDGPKGSQQFPVERAPAYNEHILTVFVYFIILLFSSLFFW